GPSVATGKRYQHANAAPKWVPFTFALAAVRDDLRRPLDRDRSRQPLNHARQRLEHYRFAFFSTRRNTATRNRRPSTPFLYRLPRTTCPASSMTQSALPILFLAFVQALPCTASASSITVAPRSSP